VSCVWHVARGLRPAGEASGAAAGRRGRGCRWACSEGVQPRQGLCAGLCRGRGGGGGCAQRRALAQLGAGSRLSLVSGAAAHLRPGTLGRARAPRHTRPSSRLLPSGAGHGTAGLAAKHRVEPLPPPLARLPVRRGDVTRIDVEGGLAPSTALPNRVFLSPMDSPRNLSAAGGQPMSVSRFVSGKRPCHDSQHIRNTFATHSQRPCRDS
jgi:hypothetical protein